MLFSEQIRAARVMLEWSQETLAQRAGVGTATVKRIEARRGPAKGNAESVWKIQKALEDGGIMFISADVAAGPGVRLAAPYPPPPPQRRVRK